ncbi:hypothetical protein M3Y94_00369000 [Aphelenchoides besseyi]|nr:hypothetical protein M3Y94_00369000 [Aphelenchoides besseyi]
MDFFTTIIETKWRWCLLFFSLSFLASWILFTLVYYTIALYHGDFEHIGNPNWQPCVSNGYSFLNLYIFSFTTQSTIGYGFRYLTDSCPLTIMTSCVQFITGVVLQTLMAGVIFAKLARPIKRAATILFSKHAVICQRDGKLCLLFRVGDMRKSSLAEAHIRLQMIKKCVTLENEVLPFHQFDMNVGYDSGLDRVFVIWPITICHEIDESSPLYDISKKSLANSRFEIIAILEGVVESVGSTTQARTSYLPNEILFEKLVTYQRDNGEYLIDFEKFHNVFDVDMPECSARELDEMRSTSRSSGSGLLKKVSFEDIPRPIDRNSIPTVSLPNVDEATTNCEYNDRCIIIDSSEDEKEELDARDATLSPFVDDNRKSTWIWVASLLASLLVAVIISIAVTISVYKWYHSLKTAQAKLAETRLFWPPVQPIEPQPEVKTPEVQVAKKTIEKVPVVELTNQEAYKKTVEDAQHRAQLLGEKLSSKQWLHKDFLRGRHPPRSHEYTVGPEAPLKELEVDVTQPTSIRMDSTQREEDDVKTAVEEFISDETAVEMQHPLYTMPMFSTVVSLLKLPKYSQRFEIYFKLQPLSIINTLKRANLRLTKYRDSLKVDSPMHQEVSKELMEISKLHQIAKEVMNAKKGVEKYRLPYSFQTGEELGMLTRDQLVFAICHECIDEEQVRELKRIVKQMEHRLLIRKAANETERTPQDVEIDKMKERQILMLRTFIEMASKLIAKQKTTVTPK